METWPNITHGNGWRLAPAYAPAAIRQLEEEAEQRYGLSPDTLMENAGASAARYLLERWNSFDPILVLAGAGNNGGDGLVAARYLARAGRTVHVVAHPKAKQQASELFLKNAQRLADCGVTLLDEAPSQPGRHDKPLIIDALFGTGFRGELDEASLTLLSAWPDAECIAFDVPSGLNAETGVATAGTRKAVLTLAFGALKSGYYLEQGRNYCGRIHAIDIGLPLATEHASWLRASRAPATESGFHFSHKYERGLVYIIAGSAGMTGAASYAARAAFRMGAGIVHMLVPAGLLSAYETLVPFAVKTGIGDQSDTFFKKKHLGPVLEKLATKKGVLVLGPGAGTHPETTAFFADVLTENTYPAIADADALLAAASLENRANLLLTPHSGELSRLTAQSASTDTERAAATRSLVEKTGTTVLAKGNRSFLMAPGQKPVVIDYDTSMFTRAGFGDVLAGAIAPYFVQHHNAWEAALSGAFEMKRIAEYTARLEYLTPDDILWQ